MCECLSCGNNLGELEDGDVIMCLRCGQWHHCDGVPFGTPTYHKTTPRGAAVYAREKPEGMDNYDILQALDDNAAMMVPEDQGLYAFPRNRRQFYNMQGHAFT